MLLACTTLSTQSKAAPCALVHQSTRCGATACQQPAGTSWQHQQLVETLTSFKAKHSTLCASTVFLPSRCSVAANIKLSMPTWATVCAGAPGAEQRKPLGVSWVMPLAQAFCSSGFGKCEVAWSPSATLVCAGLPAQLCAGKAGSCQDLVGQVLLHGPLLQPFRSLLQHTYTTLAAAPCAPRAGGPCSTHLPHHPAPQESSRHGPVLRHVS